MTARADSEDETSAAASPAGEAVRDLTQAEAAAEFETLADNMPALCWMAHADGHIYWYNRRWYEYTGTSIETQAGWGWETVHDPAVLPSVVKRWQHSLDHGTPFEMTFPLKGADGVYRPFLTRIVPIRDEAGSIVRWFGTNTDVESLHRTQAALQLRTAELESLYDSAPIGLAFFSRDYRYLRINPELARANGQSVERHIGRTVSEVVPEAAPSVEPVIDRIFEGGEPLRDVEISAESPAAPGTVRHWLTGFYPVLSDRGEVDAVGAWVVDITERKAAQERELLLAREVDHRAKNLLAVVQSIVQLTPGEDGPTLKASVIGRIQALARAHSLLSDARWNGVDLGQLIDEELAPYASNSGDRVQRGGPRIMLRPAAAQSLALVLHELATNAAKYGSLSADRGTLRIAWSRGGGEDSGMVEILWSEHGGPAVEEPNKVGFGSNIIRTSVERQLRGRVSKDWRPEGLVCRLRIPAVEVSSASDG
jgi:PAS domain S-box-containing protein